jgi:O-antigen/teichoic acid export membrane protein
MFGRRQLFGDIGTGVGASIILALAAAFSTVALARFLTIEQFGKVSVLLLAFNLTSTFDAVRPVTIYFANRFSNQPQQTFASIFWINAGIGGILSSLLTLAAFIAPQNIFQRFELLCLAGVYMLFFLQSAYWGWADAHGLVARTAMIRALGMMLVYVAFVAFAAVGMEDNKYVLILVVATASMLGGLAWICHSRNLVRVVVRPDPIIMRAIATEVRRCMQFNLATLVLATVDRMAISFHGGPRSLGLYSGNFDLATKPMALARAVQSALNPHITRAVASKSEVFEVFAYGTKAVFGLTSLTVWGALLLREPLTHLLLGPGYDGYQDVFAAVILAQCFVLLGYASALLLNSIGDFRLQKTYYLIAASVMIVIAFPAAQVMGAIGVAVAYLIVRTVDLWLFHSALRAVSQHVLGPKVFLVAIVWCSASLWAWLHVPILCCACSTLFVVLLWRWEFTQTFTQQPKALAFEG